MTRPVTTRDLLPSEQAFVAAMQQLGSGRFEYLQIRGGELILTPWPVTVRYIQFATPKRAGVPTAATSELRPQVTELFTTCVRRTPARYASSKFGTDCRSPCKSNWQLPG